MYLVLIRLAIALAVSFVSGVAQDRTDNGRMFWIRSDDQRPFTDEQLKFLVSTASSILIEQSHAGFDIDAHHEFTRRAKALDPTVRVYAYMSGTYMRSRFEWLEGVIVDDWILRDRNGEPIVHKFRANGEVSAWFADLSNPEYRSFVSGVAAEWMRTAPYDGIILDASNYLHGDVSRTFLLAVPAHPRERTRFRDLITQAKMDAVNAGLEALFREIRSSIGDKAIVWNGFWRKAHTINRSLGLMPLGDISIAERWSITRPPNQSGRYHTVLSRTEILEDLELVQDGLAAGKSFLLKDTIDENWYVNAQPDALAKLARFGWGMYMMIREPGRVSYGLAPGPRYHQNTASDPVLLDPTAFGDPQGPFVDLGDVLMRTFANGVVYMNPTPSPVDVVVQTSLQLLHGAGVATQVEAGTTISVPSRDAVFFTGRGDPPAQVEADRKISVPGRPAAFFTRSDTPPADAVTSFGASTAGCQGQVTLDVVSAPWIGNPSFGLTSAKASPGAVGTFILSGSSRTAPLELLGVQMWVDLNSRFFGGIQAMSDPLGIAHCPLPLPADPSLVGFRFFAQFAASDPCARRGISASHGLAITVH